MIRKAAPATSDGKKSCALSQINNLLKNKKMNLMQYQDEMHQLTLNLFDIHLMIMVNLP